MLTLQDLLDAEDQRFQRKLAEIHAKWLGNPTPEIIAYSRQVGRALEALHREEAIAANEEHGLEILRIN